MRPEVQFSSIRVTTEAILSGGLAFGALGVAAWKVGATLLRSPSLGRRPQSAQPENL